MSSSILTEAQLSTYLSHINLPIPFHSYRYTTKNSPASDLHFLTLLHTHTITTLPYENLSLHYNPTHTTTVSPLTTYHKTITTPHSRGGYCMELSLLYLHVLRALNFYVYPSMVRIRYRDPSTGVPGGPYIGHTHIVNLVTLADGSKYHLDVAFGGDGATRPMPLVHDVPQTNLGNQEIRLVRDWIPAQTLRVEESKLWIYQFRNSVTQEWNSYYAFGEDEAMEPDFEILNFWTSSRGAFQAKGVVVVKFLGKEDERGERRVYGKRMLSGTVVKENLGGRTRVVEVCGSEGERVEALRKWFGITLTEEETGGIRGWQTEILS